MNIKDAAQHLHNATKRIRDLEQQRAELLEALKEARKELELYAEDAGDDPYNNPMLNDIITKTEAAE